MCVSDVLRRGLIKAAILLLFAGASSNAVAQDTRIPGRQLWREMTRAEKLAYLNGVVEGAAISHRLMGRIWRDTVTAKIAAMRGTTFGSQSSLDSLGLLMLDPLEIPIAPVVELMDRLYEDPANSCVALIGAVLISSRILKGGGDDEVAAMTKSWRRPRRGGIGDCS
jgi:hypothetical protein